MAFPSMSIPLARATEAQRTAYLRRTLGLTVLGLGIASVTGIVTSIGLAFMPGMLSGYLPMIIILGMWAVSNFVAQPMVFRGPAGAPAKAVGFALGTASQGVAMGFLLLVAAYASAAALGNPFTLIALAMGLTGFTGLGMAAYVWTDRKDFSLIGAGLSAMTIPMLILMAVSFAFPSFIGGTLGIVMSAVFVVISAAGLVYQLNKVIHEYDTDMHIEGAYTISMGLLVLFWNILSLLMRLTRR
ncbi:MAG: Bax inhibitor-1 family protein [Pseudomonadota bacterium]|nr:Bax inhibitor-1 family protein [Pseudomonadota bacterium]